jgi:hypothetical protein
MQMMHDAYAKIDTFFLFEGLVKVIVNIIRNIVSFDFLKSKSKIKERDPNKS